MSTACLLQYGNGGSRQDASNSHKGRSEVHTNTTYYNCYLYIYKISVHNFVVNPYSPPAWIPYTIAVKDSGLLGCYTVQQG